MRNEFWTNDTFMDVFVQFLRVSYQDSKRIKVKVRWWNRGYTRNPWPLIDSKIIIHKKDLKNWQPCNEYGERYI